jgi:hypothetical protein
MEASATCFPSNNDSPITAAPTAAATDVDSRMENVSQPVTPVDPKETGFQFFCFSILQPCFVIVCCFLHFRFLFSLSFLGVVDIDSDAKAATSGFDTHDKRNRCKRAAKDDRTPPKMKKE